MSVTMAKADGVTVFTLTSDPQSSCPPLCQILAGLCYSPVCCSVSQHLKRVQKSSQSVLGALHIMVGLLNIGLGAILTSGDGVWWMRYIGFPFWLGALFMFFGVVSILSEKFPSPCLVILSVILNLAGAAFAITAIVLYTIQLTPIGFWLMCGYDYYYYPRRTTPSPHEDIMKEKCLEGGALVQMILRSIDAVLIVLSVLELCVTISSAVLGLSDLCSREKKENKHLKTVQKSSQSVLGALHIMVGLLNIGLGAILLSSDAVWSMRYIGFPFWLGAVFMLFGVVSILSEKFPSPCLVILSVILNLAGAAFAITAIVLYSRSIGYIDFWWMCRSDDYHYYSRRTTPSPHEDIMKEKCLEGGALMILRSIDAVLIVLSVLELCVTISSAVLGIKALRSREKKENKSSDDPEHCKPLLEDVTNNLVVTV
ncbi:Membrane-spanning 4-domains subfamily A member 8 [Nibea albiflora]|uniref:Membrane-spanning 4-domains subfamily A member 8 n=1 Tax=Nibea albiflora TaxID=240163 RepID=A0ACB7F6S0_NIBAL|nr:Membrane-spanning 4-domains subfamily A member 8 [Nibea albiflora]